LAVRVAWDTGLRWGDLTALRVDQITEGGLVRLQQSKVRRSLLCRLSPSTWALAQQSVWSCPRGVLLPWTCSHETFGQQVAHLVRLAGIRPGSWKWLRRGSATDVELAEAGSATAFLGHRPGSRVAATNYLDPEILGVNRRLPRELAPGK
jgi:integrase